jgi:hypothetical protein
MPECAGITRSGQRCTMVVGPLQTHCYQHDPDRAKERQRNASKGGQSKGSGEIVDLKRQLRKLAADVLSGKVGRGEAIAVNQIINTRARLIEIERKIKEQDDHEERLEAVESVLKTRRPTA